MTFLRNCFHSTRQCHGISASCDVVLGAFLLYCQFLLHADDYGRYSTAFKHSCPNVTDLIGYANLFQYIYIDQLFSMWLLYEIILVKYSPFVYDPLAVASCFCSSLDFTASGWFQLVILTLLKIILSAFYYDAQIYLSWPPRAFKIL